MGTIGTAVRLTDLEAYLSSASLKRLLALVDGRDDAIISLVDEDLQMLWASPLGSESLFGRVQSEFAGLDAVSFVHPEDRASFVENYRRAKNGDAASWRVRAQAADGEYRLVRTIVWPVEAAGDVAFVGITLPVQAAGDRA